MPRSGERIWQAWQRIQRIYRNKPTAVSLGNKAVRDLFDAHPEEGQASLEATTIVNEFLDGIARDNNDICVDLRRDLGILALLNESAVDLRIIGERGEHTVRHCVLADAPVIRSGLEPSADLVRYNGIMALRPLLEIEWDQERVFPGSCLDRRITTAGYLQLTLDWQNVRGVGIF